MTAPTTPNAELAYRVLDLATANGDRFDMGGWGWGPDISVGLDELTDDGAECGTSACLAGWTVALHSYRVGSDASVYDAHGNRLGSKADAVAAELLGLTEDEADRLFYAPNDSIDSRVAEIFGPRPERAS